MNKVAKAHITLLKTAVLAKHSAGTVCEWLLENTKMGLDPFSFYKHEFQEKILRAVATDINVQKCAQVGISEVSARKALALVNILPKYTVIYTLPTASFAGKFAKTRIDPIIQASEMMSRQLVKGSDNNETKQFDQSFLWIRGAASSNAPISIPADHLIHDEYDFSDHEVLGQYQSRLNHSEFKRTDAFSTPTLPDFGINKRMKESVRWYLMCKCDKCNHQFIPNYYKHVKIPGYSKDLREITKLKLPRIDWKSAVLLCPACGRVPSLLPEHREWVAENPTDNFEAVGFQVSPFDAPLVVSCSSLVKKSTTYTRRQDFDNFDLGQAAEDSEATLLRADFEGLFNDDKAEGAFSYVMGVDVGNTYYFVIGAITGTGQIHVVHTEEVPVKQARKRYFELRASWRVRVTVMDSLPHVETVMALQEIDRNLYAAVYTSWKGVETHRVVIRDAKEDKGVQFLRQVNVNRNRAFDAYMDTIRQRLITYRDNELHETIISHHTSMKRARVYDNDTGELSFNWVKTDGNDHFHHACVYMGIAARIRGVGAPLVPLPLMNVMSFSTLPKQGEVVEQRESPLILL